MAKHNFSAMGVRFPEVIQEMKQSFTSHEFIAKFSEMYPIEYEEAIDAYRGSRKHLHVHSQLSSMLKKVKGLECDGRAKSLDLFGHSNTCSSWKKVA